MKACFDVDNTLMIGDKGEDMADQLFGEGSRDISVRLSRNYGKMAKQLMLIYGQMGWSWLRLLNKDDVRRMVEYICDSLDQYYPPDHSKGDKVFDAIDKDGSCKITVGEMMEYGPNVIAETFGFELKNLTEN